MSNPNRLEGHEGKLLQIRRTVTGFGSCENKEEWDKWETATSTGWTDSRDLEAGTVGMIVSLGLDQYEQAWIDLLIDEKVYRIFFRYNRWMEHFIPWPHGAFIEE